MAAGYAGTHRRSALGPQARTADARTARAATTTPGDVTTIASAAPAHSRLLSPIVFRFSRLRSVRRAVALGVLALTVSVPPGSSEESISDLRRQREQNREALVDALAEVDLIGVELEVIAEKVDEIQALVDGQQAQVDSARRALAATESEVLAREQRAADAEAAIETTIVAIRGRAVDAYVGTNTTEEPWLGSGDPNRTAIRIALLDFTAGNERDLLDDLRHQQAELEANVRAGQAARIEADQLRAELELELAELERQREVQRTIEAELAVRLDDYLHQVAAIEQDSADIEALIDEEIREELGFSPGSAGAASIEGFVMPTAGSIGSGFGSRLHPIFGYVRQHTGVDIGSSTGNPIWASKQGKVISAGWRGGYGNTVVILHEGGVATLYAHMSEIHASTGDIVDQGEVIGEIGSTGFSTGPHLHFEVRIDGVPKDPVLFLPV